MASLQKLEARMPNVNEEQIASLLYYAQTPSIRKIWSVICGDAADEATPIMVMTKFLWYLRAFRRDRQVLSFQNNLDTGFLPYVQPIPLTTAEESILQELSLNKWTDYVVQSPVEHEATYVPALGVSIAGPIPSRDEAGRMPPSDLSGSFTYGYEELRNYWMTLGEATHLYTQAFQIAQMLNEYSNVELPSELVPVFTSKSKLSSPMSELLNFVKNNLHPDCYEHSCLLATHPPLMLVAPIAPRILPIGAADGQATRLISAPGGIIGKMRQRGEQV